MPHKTNRLLYEDSYINQTSSFSRLQKYRMSRCSTYPRFLKSRIDGPLDSSISAQNSLKPRFLITLSHSSIRSTAIPRLLQSGCTAKRLIQPFRESQLTTPTPIRRSSSKAPRKKSGLSLISAAIASLLSRPLGL